MVSSLLELSQQLLRNVRYGKENKLLLAALRDLHVSHVKQQLSNDNGKKAFWINIYNATVQLALKEHPEQYKNRMAFYERKAIEIAGKRLSPNDIEHGILRRSQWMYGLGYLPNWFPTSFEKAMRVAQLDVRIHFALNCGAKSCPPILFYDSAALDQQLDTATQAYLQDTTRVENASLFISKLFLFYHGDFKSKKKVVNLLVKYDALPTAPFRKIKYDRYHWDLSLDMYR